MPESTKSTWESITSSLSSFVTGLFSRFAPYDINHKKWIYSQDDEKNPIIQRIAFLKDNRDKLFQDINNNRNSQLPPLTEERFNTIIKYYIPERIKESDIIKVKDGQLTYEDIQKAISGSDNISKNDSPLGKKIPKIFLMPELPESDPESRYALEKEYNNITNITHFVIFDTILINRDFISKITREEAVAAIGHEAGHGIDYNTCGYAEAEYNAGKHISSLFLGSDKFLDSCARQLVSGDPKNISTECKRTLEFIEDHKNKYVVPEVENKNVQLAHEREILADNYAILAGHGNGIITYFENSDFPNSNTHPSNILRVENARQVMANPDYYKNELEKNLAAFKKFASDPTNSDNNYAKTPALTPPQASVKSATRTSTH